MRIKVFVVLIFLSTLLPACMFSQEKEASRYSLNPIIVTATKIPQQEENVTQKVDIIEREEFPNIAYDYGNIAELLTYQPGTFVNVLSRNDANWGSYGGLGPKYNTYLLDGIPIDSFVDGMSIDPWVLGQGGGSKRACRCHVFKLSQSGFCRKSNPPCRNQQLYHERKGGYAPYEDLCRHGEIQYLYRQDLS